jgi:hypothetical protein
MVTLGSPLDGFWGLPADGGCGVAMSEGVGGTGGVFDGASDDGVVVVVVWPDAPEVDAFPHPANTPSASAAMAVVSNALMGKGR